MYTIWVFGLTLGLAAADVSLGYHYKIPETSFGVPSYQVGGVPSRSTSNVAASSSTSGTNSAFAVGSGNSNIDYSASSGNVGFGTTTGHNFNTHGAAGGSGFNYITHGSSGSDANYYSYPTASSNLNTIGTGFTSQGGYHEYIGQNIQSNLDGYYQTGGAASTGSHSTGSGFLTQYQPPHEHQFSAVEKYQQYYNQILQQPPQIYKHYYIHAAPEEPEAPRPRLPVLPPPQKHYKIIFIKAPAQSAPAPQIIPVPQQTEEKTIVYVLVKKPEDAQNIVLPKFEQKAPSKPEVYFIKYNNKQDSQAVINNIVNEHNKYGTKFSATGTGDSGTVDSVGHTNAGAAVSSGVSYGVPEISSQYVDNKYSSVSTGGTPLQINGAYESNYASTASETAGNVPGSSKYYTDYRYGNDANVFSSATTGSSGNVNAYATYNDGATATSSSASTGAPVPSTYYGYPVKKIESTNQQTGGSGAISSAISGSDINAGSITGSAAEGFITGVSQTGNQNADSHGAQYSTSSYESSVPGHVLENIFGTPSSEASSSVSSGHSVSTYDASAISTSQGTPQKTYGYK